EVSVAINAQPSTVWGFMDEPSKFLAWMTYLPGAPAPEGSVYEPRPGGELRIVFPNGGVAKGRGVEVHPPRRLVFTWGYGPDVAKTGIGRGACRVEITLAATAEGTRVTLRQSGAMSEEVRQGHVAGWRHYLAMLAVQSAARQHEPSLEALL